MTLWTPWRPAWPVPVVRSYVLEAPRPWWQWASAWRP